MPRMSRPKPIDADALAPPRFNLSGYWSSTAAREWYVGPTCIDLTWPWLVWR